MFVYKRVNKLSEFPSKLSALLDMICHDFCFESFVKLLIRLGVLDYADGNFPSFVGRNSSLKKNRKNLAGGNRDGKFQFRLFRSEFSL